MPAKIENEWLFLHLILISALLMRGITSTSWNGDVNRQIWCQDLCHCVKPERSIMCFPQDKLKEIPTHFPEEYRKLSIQNPIFTSNVLRASNLTGLHDFISVKIIYSKLIRVTSYTFINMRALETLDLSANQLEKLEPFAFSGLTLKSLNLQDNPGLSLQVDSFRGLKAKEISLRNNKLKKLHVEAFYGLGLERLLLFNNLVEELDPRFEEIFYSPTSLLDLSQNPLRCSCNLIWLARYMRLVLHHSNPRDVHVTCQTPERLHNQPIHSLLTKDFDCPELAIKEIIIDLKRSSTSSQGKLECRAAGNRPLMASLHSRSTDKEMPTSLSPRQDQSQQEVLSHKSSSASGNIVLSQSSNSFTCRAWTVANSSEEISEKAEVVIDIRVPSEWIGSNSNNISASISTQEDDDGDDEDVPFLMKGRFTMMELLLAIIGTCLFTLLLTFLLSWSRPCLHAWKEHLFKEKDNKPSEQESQHLHRSVGAQIPLKYCWSGHGSIHSSFMDTSHHDVYDVPQTPTQALPQMIASSAPAENSSLIPYYYPYHYLDFKTQQRLPRDSVS